MEFIQIFKFAGLLSLHNPVARAVRASEPRGAGRAIVKPRYNAGRGRKNFELTGDARPRFFESLCSRSRCGAREAMTVG